MKWLAVIVLVMLTIGSVVAAVDRGIVNIEPAPIKPIINEATRIQDERAAIAATKLPLDTTVEEIPQYDNNILVAVLQHIGLAEAPTATAIIVEDTVLGVVPVDSPIIDLPVTQYCLDRYPFGTRQYVTCAEAMP